MGLQITYSLTESRCGSCGDSHSCWRGHMCKNSPGCLTQNSKTTMKAHALALDLGQKVGTALAVEMGLGRGWGLCHWRGGRDTGMLGTPHLNKQHWQPMSPLWSHPSLSMDSRVFFAISATWSGPSFGLARYLDGKI